MKVPKEKTQCMTFISGSQGVKLAVKNHPIEQAMEVNYLGVTINSF